MDMFADADRVDVYDPIQEIWYNNCGKIVMTDYSNLSHTVQLDNTGLHVNLSFDTVRNHVTKKSNV